MRKLVYLVASTLDGFIAETSREDPSGTVFELEGDHALALAEEYPEMLPAHVRAHLGTTDVPHRHFDTVLEGRVSYEMGLALGVENAYPHLRHLVFSTTMGEPADPAIEVVRTDAVERQSMYQRLAELSEHQLLDPVRAFRWWAHALAEDPRNELAGAEVTTPE